MHTSANWSELYADAGATTCPECGKMSSFLEGGVSGPVDVDAQDPTHEPVRFCFECGHEEHTAR